MRTRSASAGTAADDRPSMGVVLAIAGEELRAARRHHWFWVVAGLYALLALALSWLGASGLGAVGLTGFGRTAASLASLAMLVVPLLGLLLGATTVARERERGTHIWILAQPITPGELLAGKFLGLVLAMLGTISVGFGLSALVLAWSAGPEQIHVFLRLLGATLLLGLASVSLGILASALVRTHAAALTAGLVVWLGFVFLSDAGLMGTALLLQLAPATLFWLAVANPVQAFKLLALATAQGHLDLLGSPALYAANVLGPHLTTVLAALMGAWTVGPSVLAWWVFERRPL